MRLLCQILQKISTHTLTWSVTCTANPCKTYAKFQLTRSRGAWQVAFYLLLAYRIFQLTRSRGAWLVKITFTELVSNFNSHAHVERDRRQYRSFTNSGHFNSHAHVERDLREVFRHSQFFISTHTLTWSVTRIALQSSASKGFQLTRSRGAWPLRSKFRWQQKPFQLTRSRGAWHSEGLTNMKKGISTHTLTWSVTISIAKM